jgi:hypothetical protein
MDFIQFFKEFLFLTVFCNFFTCFWGMPTKWIVTSKRSQALKGCGSLLMGDECPMFEDHVGHQLPFDKALLPRRMEMSAALLQKPNFLEVSSILAKEIEY